MLIEATTGFRPNGVEFVLAEVRKHSGELSNACDFSGNHHRESSPGIITGNHHRESSPGIITGLDLKGLFPKGFAVREKAKHPKLELLRLFRQKIEENPCDLDNHYRFDLQSLPGKWSNSTLPADILTS